jgi:hypothetical protein
MKDDFRSLPQSLQENPVIVLPLGYCRFLQNSFYSAGTLTIEAIQYEMLTAS